MSFLRRQKPEDDNQIEPDQISEPESKPRRRRRQKDAITVEEVELERVAPDVPIPDEDIPEYTRRQAPEEAPRRRRINFKRLLVWREIRPGLLFLAAGLVIGGVFWTLYNLDRVPSDAREWWPAALLGFALLWALLSLIIRKAGALLAASTLAGLSVSLLLDTQGYITWRDSLVGVMLVTIGIGIMLRGLLLRQGSVA
jgi:hypothetical protein